MPLGTMLLPMQDKTKATHTLTDLAKGKVYDVRIVRTLKSGNVIVETIEDDDIAGAPTQYEVKPGSSFLKAKAP